MTKSIIQRVKYIEQKQISEYDRDQIEPIVYLNIFKANDTLYGFKEYDYFRNGALKSKAWNLGCYIDLQFIKKDVEEYNKQKITIIQRAKEVN
jgi:hypothetical protein